MQPFNEAMRLGKCSLASDGWQDAHKRPLVNVCAITPEGSTFVKAVDTTGETKVLGSHSCQQCPLTLQPSHRAHQELTSPICLQDAQYMAKLWIEAIEEIGEENVMQILSDSAANCKKAGELVQER